MGSGDLAREKEGGGCLLFHINLLRLFNAKSILLEEQKWYYLTHI